MTRIPTSLRHDVISEIYRQFDEMKWEERTQPERSSAYQRFVDDPKVGGLLAQHIPVEKVRVWIKDGPAKEYRRALEGVGPYSDFTTRFSVGAEGVVAAVLEPGWTILDKSVREKPMRCIVEHDRRHRLVVWGPDSSLKELFWHIAVHVSERSGVSERPLLVLTKRGNAPIDAAVWRRAESLAGIVDCDVVQTSLGITRKVDAE